jgi:hypothetical protein
MATIGNKCAECGRPTVNPKFCDKSCAAKFNNRRSPKRKPEGACASCRAPITSGKRLCAACTDANAAAAKDRADGFFTIRRLDGSTERVKTKHVSLTTRTIVGPIGPERVAAASPAARVFEVVLGLLANGPEWLRLEERARYATLFRDLARFPVRTRDRKDHAETLPTADLPRAASQWLNALARDQDPLLLSFGLDAVEFFFQLVMGRRSYGEGPDLEPLVDIHPELERGFFSDSRSMRKYYTERVLGRLPVVAHVPERACIRRDNGEPLIPEGQPFGLEIVRCHLSENPLYEATRLVTEWPRLRPFDRATEFSFRSRLLLARTGANQVTAWMPTMQVLHEDGPLIDVPAHWITGILNLHDDPEGEHPTPVRTWGV